MNSLGPKVMSSMLWKFAERILVQGISIVVSSVIARILSPSDYGLVSMVLIFINVANVFISSGFPIALIQKKDSDDLDFSTVFYCELILSLILYTILYFTSPFIENFCKIKGLARVIKVFSLILPISSYKAVQDAYVSKMMDFRKFFFSTLGGTIVSGIVGIFLAVKGFGVWALVTQHFVNVLMDTTVLAFTIKWRLKFIFSWNRAKGLLSYSSKLLGADVIGTLYSQLTPFIIGKKYTTIDLAFYTKGRSFPDLVSNNISASLVSVMFPALSIIGDSKDQLKKLARKAVSVTAFVLFPCFFGLMACSRNLILVLLTDKWLEAVPYLCIVCIAGLFDVMGVVDLITIKAYGRSTLVLKLEFLKKPFFTIILLILMQFGILWLAMGGIIVGLIANILNGIGLQRTVGYSLWEKVKDIASSLLLSILMFIIVYFMNYLPLSNIITLILQVTVGVGSYVGLAILTKNTQFIYVLGILKTYVSIK